MSKKYKLNDPGNSLFAAMAVTLVKLSAKHVDTSMYKLNSVGNMQGW
jgi:hypothetical protein